MTTLKKFNISGKETGNVTVDKAFVEVQANNQMVKDYIVAIRNNGRQWSASTKTRAEVKHTTKKPFRQKGTGNARQGSLVSPQYKGGGIVHGPKPKFDQHVKVNQKEKRAAIRALISEKVKQERVILIEDFEMEAPKTKTVHQFLKSCQAERQALILVESAYEEVKTEGEVKRVNVRNKKHENFAKSIRNLPNASMKLAGNISGYDVLKAHYIVATESAWKELNEWLNKG